MKSSHGTSNALLQVLFSALFVLSIAQAGQAATITVKNNCGYQIAIGMYPPVYNSGGAFLGAGATVSFGAWASGTGGRLWSRHNCAPGPGGFDICSSGTCGGSGVSCNGTTAAGVTEAEINFNAGGADWYDISYVDGYNDMANITPSVGYAPFASSKPSCPTLLNDGYGGVYTANGDSCQSPCNAANQNVSPYNQNTDRWCCHGAYATSATCNEGSWPSPESNYVNQLHAATTGEYTYAYDDTIGLHQTTANSSYTITFCPSSSGTSTSSSSSSTTSSGGAPITAGYHTLAPSCAPGSRLDDTNGATANGTGMQIWAATGGSNQSWNFANVGGASWNAAVNGPYCLDDNGGAQGTQVALWGCNGGVNQKWTAAQDGSSAQYKFLNGAGLCMDVSGALSANGTKVQSYTCNGTGAQSWTVY